jgi:hypothetical protein
LRIFAPLAAARAAALQEAPVGIQKRRVLPTNRDGDDNGRLQMLYLVRSGPAARALADRGVAALAAVVSAAGDDPSSIDHHG